MSTLASIRARLQRLEKQRAEQLGDELEQEIDRLITSLPIAILFALSRDGEDERLTVVLEEADTEGLSERETILTALRRIAQLDFSDAPRRLQ